ncbi:MAG: YggS family pyridoxal phosphate-dependent enzyme [Cyclobacteriaceae bacterium]
MIAENIKKFKNQLTPTSCKLVAVSKTKPKEDIEEAYAAGQRIFGENKAQEMQSKHDVLPKDIEWHMIGHLQRNKVKYIAPFVDLIHSIDSLKLIKEIQKEASKNERVINCLIQIHIAKEESKFGFDEEEIIELLKNSAFSEFKNIRIVGLMGMATNTNNTDNVKEEFKSLKRLFDQIKEEYSSDNIRMEEISMGMSGDYKIAIEEGSTLVRIGSSIFGSRNYG